MLDTNTSSSPEHPANAVGGKGDNFSPVSVRQNDTVGAIFLGIIAIALFVALRRAEARYRELAAQLAAGR